MKARPRGTHRLLPGSGSDRSQCALRFRPGCDSSDGASETAASPLVQLVLQPWKLSWTLPQLVRQLSCGWHSPQTPGEMHEQGSGGGIRRQVKVFSLKGSTQPFPQNGYLCSLNPPFTDAETSHLP